MQLNKIIYQAAENVRYNEDVTLTVIAQYKAATTHQRHAMNQIFKTLLGYNLGDLIGFSKRDNVPPFLTRAISIPWAIEDVQQERPDLNDEQAAKVLEEVRDCHDATVGINWEVIQCMADNLYPEP